MTTYSQDLTVYIFHEGSPHQGWELLVPLYQIAGMAPGCFLQLTGFGGSRMRSYNPVTGVWSSLGTTPLTLTIPSTIPDHIDSCGNLVVSPYDAAYLAAYLAAGGQPYSCPPFLSWSACAYQTANIAIGNQLFITGNTVTITCDDYSVYAHASRLIERGDARGCRGGPPPFSVVGDELTPP